MLSENGIQGEKHNTQSLALEANQSLQLTRVQLVGKAAPSVP
jgi:hypothetical protein